jgi:hypothetical protein
MSPNINSHASLMQGLDKMTPELRMLRLELQHAVAAIERASLLAHGSGLEADLSHLLEAAKATLDLAKVDALVEKER